MNVRRLIIAAVTVFLLGTLFTAGFHSLAVAKNKSDTASSFNKNVSELPSPKWSASVSMNCCRALIT